MALKLTFLPSTFFSPKGMMTKQVRSNSPNRASDMSEDGSFVDSAFMINCLSVAYTHSQDGQTFPAAVARTGALRAHQQSSTRSLFEKSPEDGNPANASLRLVH
jgi:hypothetical protein